jgi:hypothetical protein
VKAAMSHAPFGATLLRLAAGPLVWAAHFLAIYAFTALACARDLARPLVPWAIGGMTVIAVLAALGIIGWTGRQTEEDDSARFIAWISAAFACLALVAIVWEALPALLVPICI